MSLFLPHIYGQEKVQKEWKSLLKNNRFPHTLILYGDDGLGKTTAAFDLAGILTGESEKISGEFDELHISSAREEMTLPMAGNRLWYLRPGKMELKVEQFRTFLESMESFDEKAHVCIIDECQFMRAAAANIMLKTFEEPQSNVYYILISTDLNSILPTVISRSEKFAFTPLGREEYLALLQRESSKYPVPVNMTPDMLYQLSEGNPGITLEICSEKDNAQPDAAMSFWETITDNPRSFSALNGHKWKDRDEFHQMLRWIILVGRDILVLAETGDQNRARCMSVMGREMAVSRKWNGKVMQVMEVFRDAELAYTHYINIKNIWDMILIQLKNIQRGRKE